MMLLRFLLRKGSGGELDEVMGYVGVEIVDGMCYLKRGLGMFWVFCIKKVFCLVKWV